MNWLKDFCGFNNNSSPMKKDSHAPKDREDMNEIMRRVDKQIGRAVTRLSDR